MGVWIGGFEEDPENLRDVVRGPLGDKSYEIASGTAGPLDTEQLREAVFLNLKASSAQVKGCQATFQRPGFELHFTQTRHGS